MTLNDMSRLVCLTRLTLMSYITLTYELGNSCLVPGPPKHEDPEMLQGLTPQHPNLAYIVSNDFLNTSWQVPVAIMIRQLSLTVDEFIFRRHFQPSDRRKDSCVAVRNLVNSLMDRHQLHSLVDFRL